MEFEKPSDTDFTVYSKSGCPNCSIVKKILNHLSPQNFGMVPRGTNVN